MAVAFFWFSLLFLLLFVWLAGFCGFVVVVVGGGGGAVGGVE